MLDSIFSDAQVIEEKAKSCPEHPSCVQCILKLHPNTGFDHNKIAVIVKTKFIFPKEVPFIPLILLVPIQGTHICNRIFKRSG